MTTYLQVENRRDGAAELRRSWASSPALDRELETLKRLIWLYFWLLIFEGALRKWVFPPLSAPLLVVRDPVVLLIYIQAIRCRRFPSNGPVISCFALMSTFILLAIAQTMAGVGGGPLVVAYGLRTDFLHLPLIFVIPAVFTYADVVKMGKWVLIISIPMAALMVVQYQSPPGAWVNAATKADAQQLVFVGEKIRPPGTFSFITGAGHFFVMVTAFLFYGLGEKIRVYSPLLLGGALLAVAVVQPVSGSRTLVITCALVVVAAVGFGVLNPSRAQRILAIITLMCVCVLALFLSATFREAVDTFMTRWDQANTSAGGAKEGLVMRFVSWFTEPFRHLSEAGFIGKGLGMGTNAGSAIMTGALVFLLAESEWTRVVLESGPFLGFLYLAYRVWLGGLIVLRAWEAAKRQQLLPWLLASAACLPVIVEPISQPTNLGFMVFTAGLCLASIRDQQTKVASRVLVAAPQFMTAGPDAVPRPAL